MHLSYYKTMTCYAAVLARYFLVHGAQAMNGEGVVLLNDGLSLTLTSVLYTRDSSASGPCLLWVEVRVKEWHRHLLT